MSFLSWNCRGLGNPRRVQFLKEINFQKKHDVIFLCETLCRKERVEQVKVELGFGGSFVVESIGHSGGLAMLWRNQDDGTLLSYSNNHVDMEIYLEGEQKSRLTGFYGEPKRTLRYKTWELIRRISEASNLPWCLIGDINNVLSRSDKRGGRPYPQWLISGFQEVCDVCNLRDMELIGHPYTWEKSKGKSNWVEVRLDRALVTQDWSDLFPEACLENLEISPSDHCPIWLRLGVKKKSSAARNFRFENAWTREPMCKQVVKDIWVCSNTETWQRKIKCCSTALAE